LTQDPDGVPPELHQTTWCAEKTIEFIRQERQGPWLASVNLYDPHPPFNPPKVYRDMFDPAQMPGPLFRQSDLLEQQKLEKVDFQSKGRSVEELDITSPILPQSPHSGLGGEKATTGARDAWSLQAAYYAMIKLIDDQIGRVLEALETTGQRRRTVVIFTSDHGEILGDHGLIQKGCRFYEGLVRVPLIFSWPGEFTQGVRYDALVELLDKAPTLLELAGLEVPAHMQGRSLTPVLKNGTVSSPHRDFVRCEYYDALDLPDGTLATMFRDERYKLVLYHGYEHGELYDLVEDPGEFENMWDAAEAQTLKLDLMKRSFDASVAAMDRGPRRIGPM
jgi:arylsulfatase A-like enzyme